MTGRARVVYTAIAALAAAPLLGGCQAEPQAFPGPYGAQVARAIPQVESATGLKFKAPPKVEMRSRAELREFLQAKFDESQPALELAGQERAYKLLGVIPDTLDLRSFLLALLSEQVVGYYDPATKVLYVVGDGPEGAATSPEIVNVTITHELIHALQDQYLPLDSVTKSRTENDRTMAAQAMIEGQATYEQLSVMLGGGNMFARMPGGWDRVRQMIRDSQGAMPVLGNAPVFIQETLLFPYLSGAEFVRQFKEKRPGQSVLDFVPASTEQLLHPDRLLDSLDVPLSVVLPRPSGGTLVYDNSLGEFETRLVLHQQLKHVETASRAAAGWGGDRYVVVNTPRGAGITWVSVWDSPFEAAEFRFALVQAIEKRLDLKPGTASGAVLQFAGKGRSIEVATATIQGHPAVIYTDVPAGASTRLIDVPMVRVSPAR